MWGSQGTHARVDALRTLLKFHIGPIGLAESSVARKRSQFLLLHASCSHCKDLMLIHIDVPGKNKKRDLKADFLSSLHSLLQSFVTTG